MRDVEIHLPKNPFAYSAMSPRIKAGAFRRLPLTERRSSRLKWHITLPELLFHRFT